MMSVTRLNYPASAVHFLGKERQEADSKNTSRVDTDLLRRLYLGATRIKYPTITMDEFDRLNPMEGERFQFRNSAGTKLQGYLYPLPDKRETNKVIVLGHGFSAHSGMMAPLVPLFHELGYHVFLFDFNTHGKSDGRKTSIGYHEGDDVASAMLEMRHKYGDQIRLSYLGHSMGGAAFLYMPGKIKGKSDDLKWIAGHLDKVALDSTYDVINPSQESRLQDLTKNLPTWLKDYLMGRVKAFEESSQETMKLPAPINKLHPINEFVKAGQLFKNLNILLLHGTADQRASYSAAITIRDMLAQHDYNVRLAPLEGAGHYREYEQPNPKDKDKPLKLKTVLRDEAHKQELRNFFADPPVARQSS